MNEYQLVEMENGDVGVMANSGTVIPSRILDIMLELHERDPEFFENWVAIAESHALKSYGSFQA